MGVLYCMSSGFHLDVIQIHKDFKRYRAVATRKVSFIVTDIFGGLDDFHQIKTPKSLLLKIVSFALYHRSIQQMLRVPIKFSSCCSLFVMDLTMDF